MISDFFYPDIKVSIGDYTFTKGIEVDVISSKDSYFDWAKVRFTRGFNEKITLNKYDEIKVLLGYNQNLSQVFSGYLAKSGSAKNEVIFKDKMIFLEQTTITNTFLDAIPQELIKYCLDKAGVKSYKLSEEVYQNKKQFPVYEKNVISLLNEINTNWDIQNNFFFQDDTFYWGTKPKQKYKYTFEYSKNIISLEKINNQWELTTVSVPLIKHGDVIGIDHYQISGDFEINKVIFTTNQDGFIRTKLYF